MSHRKNLKWMSLGSIVIATVIVAALNLLLANNYRRIDLTRDQIYTISPELQNIISGLKDKATLTFYASQKLPPQYVSAERFVEDNLRELAEKSDGKIIVKLEKIGTDADDESRLAKFGINRLPVGIIERDQQSITNIYFHIRVQYGPRFHVINMPDESGFEYQLAHAITKVTAKTRPRIVFVQNDPRFDFLDTIGSLLGQMGLKDIYEVISLKVEEDYPLVIPARTELLVLGKPIDFRVQELFEIDQYLMSGGQVLVFAQPTDFQNPLLMFEQDHKDWRYNFYEVLDGYGLRIRPELVEDYGSALPIPVGGEGNQAARLPSPILPIIHADRFTSETAILRDTARLLLPMAAPMEFLPVSKAPEFYAEYLMHTTEQTALQVAPEFNLGLSPDSEPPADAELASHPVAAILAGPMRSFFAGKPQPDALKIESTRSEYQVLQRQAEGFVFERRDVAEPGARVTVIGSGMMYSGTMLGNLRRLDPYLYGEQASFLANILESTTVGSDLLSIRRKQITTPVFREDLTDSQRSFARFANTFGVALLIAIGGIGRFFWRKGHLKSLRRRYVK